MPPPGFRIHLLPLELSVLAAIPLTPPLSRRHIFNRCCLMCIDEHYSLSFPLLRICLHLTRVTLKSDERRKKSIWHAVTGASPAAGISCCQHRHWCLSRIRNHEEKILQDDVILSLWWKLYVLDSRLLAQTGDFNETIQTQIHNTLCVSPCRSRSLSGGFLFFETSGWSPLKRAGCSRLSYIPPKSWPSSSVWCVFFSVSSFIQKMDEPCYKQQPERR